MSKPHRILVIRTDRIGDVVLATPLVRALRRTFPSAFIAAMVRPYARAALANNPHLDELLLDSPDGDHGGVRGFWRQVIAIRRRRFDVALLLLPTKRLAWILFFAGVTRRITVGLVPYQVLTFMETVSRKKYRPLRHEADYCLDLGRKIGVNETDLSTELFLTEAERERGLRLLGDRGVHPARRDARLIGIHPGHGGSSPNWRIDRYVELARQLLGSRPDDYVIVTVGQDQLALGAHFDTLGSDRVVVFKGDLSLRELAAVTSHLDVLISSSTGPMHMAAALKVPTVSLFCPLSACSPELWGPRGNRAEFVMPRDGYCQVECPGDPHVCRFEGGIDVDTVAACVLETDILEARPSR